MCWGRRKEGNREREKNNTFSSKSTGLVYYYSTRRWPSSPYVCKPEFLPSLTARELPVSVLLEPSNRLFPLKMWSAPSIEKTTREHRSSLFFFQIDRACTASFVGWLHAACYIDMFEVFRPLWDFRPADGPTASFSCTGSFSGWSFSRRFWPFRTCNAHFGERVDMGATNHMACFYFEEQRVCLHFKTRGNNKPYAYPYPRQPFQVLHDFSHLPHIALIVLELSNVEPFAQNLAIVPWTELPLYKLHYALKINSIFLAILASAHIL